MSILVTGGGAIGLMTADLLSARGEHVVIGDVRAVDLGHLAEQKEIASVTCDIRDPDALATVVQDHGVEAIVHTAALLSTAIRRDPVLGISVNTVGTANVLEVTRKRGLRRIVIASSTTVGYTGFGTHGPQPIEEDFPLRVVSQRPGSIYAATKLAAEHIALLYNDLYGVDIAILRYGAVLGAGAGFVTSVPGQLLSALLSAGKAGVAAEIEDPLLAWAGKEEFIDVRDCARANVAALDAKELKSRVYNIATGSWHSFDEFCAAVRAIYPSLAVDLKVAPKAGFAGFPHQRPAPSAISAAAEELGFTATYSLEQTVRHLSSRF